MDAIKHYIKVVALSSIGLSFCSCSAMELKRKEDSAIVVEDSQEKDLLFEFYEKQLSNVHSLEEIELNFLVTSERLKGIYELLLESIAVGKKFTYSATELILSKNRQAAIETMNKVRDSFLAENVSKKLPEVTTHIPDFNVDGWLVDERGESTEKRSRTVTGRKKAWGISGFSELE